MKLRKTLVSFKNYCMQTLPLSQQDFSSVVQKAAAALLRGKILVVPTDTVYGLVADATNKKAVQKIFSIKKRQKEKPLPIFVKDIAMAKTLATVSFSQEKCMRKVWPGKVTLVLKSREVLPKETGTVDRIGLRIPKHVLLQKILRMVDRPLTGTSVNLTGNPSLSEGKKIIDQFQNRKYKPDMILDAGKLPYSRPSKVIDITGAEPKSLRK